MLDEAVFSAEQYSIVRAATDEELMRRAATPRRAMFRKAIVKPANNSSSPCLDVILYTINQSDRVMNLSRRTSVKSVGGGRKPDL